MLLPLFTCRGEKSVSHMYLLTDLLAAARAKHGSALGLGLAKAAREREAARRKRAAEDASSRRREELEQDLGTELRYLTPFKQNFVIYALFICDGFVGMGGWRMH